MLYLQGAIWCLVTCVISSIELDVFSTKTLYEWSHQRNRMPTLDMDSTIRYQQSQCDAIHVTAVFRHGTRNPTDSGMAKIENLYRKLLANKNQSKFPDLEALHRTNIYNISEEGKLRAIGVGELSGLGERFGRRFNRLFATDRVRFVSSRYERCKDSSRAFYDGLTKQLQNVSDYKNSVNDTRLRFYEDCYNYEHGVDDNHFNNFVKAPEFQNVLQSVKSRLGLQIPISPDDLSLMYHLCAYELYIFNSTRWCDVMTDADRVTLEYGEDIKEYYESSYGNRLNTQLACPLVEDMFRTLDLARNSIRYLDDDDRFNFTDGFVAGKFQFGHSETITPLFTALGLYKEPTPLLGTNHNALVNRIFKTSKIVPFAANVALALYVCDDINTTAVARILVNEEGVVNPACGQMVCPYDQMKVFYGDLINTCDRKGLCGIAPKDDTSESSPLDDTNGSSPLAVSLLLLISVIVLQNFKWEKL